MFQLSVLNDEKYFLYCISILVIKVIKRYIDITTAKCLVEYFRFALNITNVSIFCILEFSLYER